MGKVKNNKPGFVFIKALENEMKLYQNDIVRQMYGTNSFVRGSVAARKLAPTSPSRYKIPEFCPACGRKFTPAINQDIIVCPLRHAYTGIDLAHGLPRTRREQVALVKKNRLTSLDGVVLSPLVTP